MKIKTTELAKITALTGKISSAVSDYQNLYPGTFDRYSSSELEKAIETNLKGIKNHEKVFVLTKILDNVTALISSGESPAWIHNRLAIWARDNKNKIKEGQITDAQNLKIDKTIFDNADFLKFDTKDTLLSKEKAYRSRINSVKSYFVDPAAGGNAIGSLDAGFYGYYGEKRKAKLGSLGVEAETFEDLSGNLDIEALRLKVAALEASLDEINFMYNKYRLLNKDNDGEKQKLPKYMSDLLAARLMVVGDRAYRAVMRRTGKNPLQMIADNYGQEVVEEALKSRTSKAEKELYNQRFNAMLRAKHLEKQKEYAKELESKNNPKEEDVQLDLFGQINIPDIIDDFDEPSDYVERKKTKK